MSANLITHSNFYRKEETMKGEKNPLTIFKTKKYIREESGKRYFPKSGLRIYVGQMGGGKTLTAVKYIKELLEKYPDVTFITNVKIRGIDNALYFSNCDELVQRLKEIDLEDNKGYLIFIDEIHVVLAELFGKTDPIFLQFLSQQRKLSIHIVGTSQMFNKLPKFIRDYLCQSGQVIACKNIFNVIQINKEANMEETKKDSEGNLIFTTNKHEWFIHTKELYESYDTFAVISQIQGLMKGEKKNAIGLYNNI